MREYYRNLLINIVLPSIKLHCFSDHILICEDMFFGKILGNQRNIIIKKYGLYNLFCSLTAKSEMSHYKFIMKYFRRSCVKPILKTNSELIWILVILFFSDFQPVHSQYQMENIDRGIVAIKTSETGVFVSWRLLNSDPETIGFNLYRGNTKINPSLIVSSTNFLDVNGTINDKYHVISVSGGIEKVSSDTVSPWTQNYLSLPLQIPAGGITPASESFTYSPNDASVGDLDGDGEYEIVLKWDPSNSKDNSQSGYTGNVILDAYKLDGTHLWRIDLGINIRAGAHYTQFMVYDLDGDSIAEVTCKTAPGSKDGSGNYLKSGPAAGDNDAADYRNTSGYILTGPEYLTIFNGRTGEEIITTDYVPPRGNLASWGDTYGNRVDRFLACIAYLDGKSPSVVMCRGYYTGSGRGRTVLAAWDYRNNTLNQRWIFNADLTGEYSGYTGQGNHNLSVGDVDNDGKDEIVYGSCAIDDNGTGLWTSGLGHGDAMHLSDIDPDRPGLEIWGIHENAQIGSALLDARTGAIIWGTGPADVGRGVSADIDSLYPGLESWGGTDGLRSAKNLKVGNAPASSNHVIWWDGDLSRELLNGNYIDKYGTGLLLTASGCSSINGTKSNPNLQADILGDWREEVIFRTTDNSALRIYTTTYLTKYRLTTFMHDPVYREGIAWQNVAYNQPPHTGFYLGADLFIADSLRPPSAPYNIKAFPFNDTVKLQWDKNPEPDLAGYNIYRSELEQGPFKRLNGTLLTENSFIDSVVLNDITYFYAATATDTLNNESRYSGIISAMPTGRPDKPAGLYSRNDFEKIKLFWDPDNTGKIAGYKVYRSVNQGGAYTLLNTSLITGTSYLDSPLTDKTKYYYVITAIGNNGFESFQTSELKATTGTIKYLQAEEGIFTGGLIESNNPGFNGTGFYNFDATSNIDFINLGGNLGGDYMLLYRYALGNTARTGLLSINGTSRSLIMQNTTSFTNYLTDSIRITLNSGFTNTIRFASTGSDFGNIDEITVKPVLAVGLNETHETEVSDISIIYPNPFSNRVNIKYVNAQPCTVRIQIFNSTGQIVRTLVNSFHSQGVFEVTWDALDVSGSKAPDGIYFCKIMNDNNYGRVKKIILLNSR
jgi:rhamnogalacturonan endolyase